MSKSDNHLSNPKLDSLHKIWKFKKLEQVPGSWGGMGSIESYDLWDLTKKDTLRYTIKDSAGVTHSIKYNMINNAIVLRFPNSDNNVDVQFKISKLTASELKLTLHLNYVYDGNRKDEDIIVQVFGAASK